MAKPCNAGRTGCAALAAAAILVQLSLGAAALAEDGHTTVTGGEHTMIRDDGFADIEQIRPEHDARRNTDISVIKQTGTGNSATVEQQAILGGYTGNYAGIVQNGTDNTGTISQTGKNDTAAIVQTGLNNSAGIAQTGNNASAGVVQNGANLGVQINQAGHGSIGVTQWGVGAPGSAPITITQH